MRLDGRLADEQGGGDLGIAVRLGEQTQDVILALGELDRRRGRARRREAELVALDAAIEAVGASGSVGDAANRSMTRRVTAGDRSASPAAATRGGDELLRARVLGESRSPACSA
jgi:hypothetical protein